jgi:hypothetical protein
VEGKDSTPAYQEEYADTLAARDWKGGVSNQDIGRKGWLAIVRSSQFAGYTEDNEVGGTLRAGGGDLGGGSEHLMISDPETIMSFPSAYSRQPTKFNDVADPLTLSAGAPAVFRKSSRAQTSEDSETWVEGDVANTLNSFDVGDVRTTHAILGGTQDDDALLPVGLDSHRYRCCGNGVVSSVAEWIGRRIVAVDVLR